MPVQQCEQAFSCGVAPAPTACEHPANDRPVITKAGDEASSAHFEA
jgi:hypothetical protein